MARDYDLTTEDIRAAVLHLLQLAAAFEGTPVEVEDDDAEATLVKVVHELAAHRGAYLEIVAQRLAVELAAPLADLYRKFQADHEATAFDLTDQVKQLFEAHGIGLTERGLDVLIVDRQDIKEKLGPVQCAAETLATALGIGSRSIFKRKAKDPFVLTPVAFSRHVSKLGLLKYVLTLFGPLDENLEKTLRDWMLKPPVPSKAPASNEPG